MTTSVFRRLAPLCASLWLSLIAFPAVAATYQTTYTYTGQPFTEFNYLECMLCGQGSSLSASVTFNFDTSTYSGAIDLSTGDIAVFGGSATYYFPYYVPSPGVYALVSTLNGSFTLVNGSITSWYLEGETYQQYCGLGPGCAAGTTTSISSPGGDSEFAFYDDPQTDGGASSSAGGTWSGPDVSVIGVPEPSTWTMMLVAFSGLCFLTRRRRQQRYEPLPHLNREPLAESFGRGD